MKILIINFNLKNLGVDDFKAQAHIDAMDFRGVEGLISKYFIRLKESVAPGKYTLVSSK